MEIISEPTYEIEDVVEWVFGTYTGVYNFFIHPSHEDSVEFTDAGSIIVETHPPSSQRETIVYNVDRLLWYSQVPRKIRKPVIPEPIQQTFTVAENTTQPGGVV